MTDSADIPLVARLALEADKKAAHFWEWRDLEDRKWLTHFAALVAEECAKVCEQDAERVAGVPGGYPDLFNMALNCAEAIRAKFKA